MFDTMVKPTNCGLIGLLIMFILHSTLCHKILLHPASMKSHFITFGKIAEHLLEHNHDFHMTIASNVKLQFQMHPSLKLLKYQVERKEEYASSLAYATLQIKSIEASESGFYEWFITTFAAITALNTNLKEECQNMMSNKEYISQLMDNNYDFLLLDPSEIVCSSALIYKLGVPTGLYSLPFNFWLYRLSYFPSTTPAVIFETSDHMDFIERLKNVLAELAFIHWFNIDSTYVMEHVPEKEPKTVMEIVQNSSLWFYAHNTVLHYPHPRMPNTLDIGDLMMRKAQPLPEEFSQLLDAIDKSFVLMSFGSFFNLLPPEWENKFCKAFEQLKSVIHVIWKSSISLKCKVPPNVSVFSWVPQNDLLADEKLKVFITHGGGNSYTEAAFHGTHMIAFPLYSDQPYNAFAMKQKGLGMTMKISQFEPSDLSDNIMRILTNASYSDNAKSISKMLHNIDMSAGNKINFWIDHVVKFGDTHLRSSGYDLTLVQFLMLDIVAVIIFFLAIMFMVGFVLVFYMVRCCRYSILYLLLNRDKQKIE